MRRALLSCAGALLAVNCIVPSMTLVDSFEDAGEGGEDATSGAGGKGSAGKAGTSNGGKNSGGRGGTAGGSGGAVGPGGGEGGDTGGVLGGGAEGGENSSGSDQGGSGGSATGGKSGDGSGGSDVAGAGPTGLCGNGDLDSGEECDRGAENGLFLGNGMGCSRYCTNEPQCRDGDGAAGACEPVCGDGNVESPEDCDDGNRRSGDGCSNNCAEEPDYTCSDVEWSDTQACSNEASAECLRVAVTYRDFDGRNMAGGHPDFFYLSQAFPCLPNASGRAVGSVGTCPSNDSTPLCPGIVAGELDSNDKPTLGASQECACRFTDWDDTGILSGAAEATTCSDSGGGIHRTIETTVRVVQDTLSFGQWYTDSSLSHKVASTLELGPVGLSFEYASSDGRTVYDDLHDIFMGRGVPAANGAPENSLSSGFFPLDGEVGVGSAKVCNLWPYWVAGASCRAQDGNPITEQWDPQGSYTPMLAGTGGPVTPVAGNLRNFYFTSEVHHLFRYEGAATVSFRGDDDVWVFVNGRLALDLGAPHEELLGTVVLDGSSATWSILTINPDGSAFPPATGGSGNLDLGLETGKTYEIAVFHADRHPRESNYHLTLPRSILVRSICSPR